MGLYFIKFLSLETKKWYYMINLTEDHEWRPGLLNFNITVKSSVFVQKYLFNIVSWTPLAMSDCVHLVTGGDLARLAGSPVLRVIFTFLIDNLGLVVVALYQSAEIFQQDVTR